MREKIEHTLLKPEATPSAITKLCMEAKDFSLGGVCVNPCYVALAKSLLAQTKVKVVTVVGFPLGATTSSIKACETKEAIRNGADEIDMVMSVGALKAGDHEYVTNDISQVVQAAGTKPVKVIIETCLLTDAEKVLAVKLIAQAKASYVKTSTGFSTGGATPQDIKLLRQEADKYDLKVKAAGGIRTKEAAALLVSLGADRIGTSAGPKLVEGEDDK